MEREQIVRDDFPVVRKGWSADAVEAHLIIVAEYVAAKNDKPTPAADVASERVGAVLAAAESTAAEIVEEAESEANRIVGAARADADQIRAAARTESEQTVSAAGREASGRIEQAQAAVEGLVAQADRLRSQVGALGRDLAAGVAGIGSGLTPAAEEELPEMPAEPEPEPKPEPEVPAAEEATPKPRGRGRRRAAKPAPTPAADGPTAAASDEDLIAQLRGGGEPAAAELPSPAVSGSDHGSARLVAMNMALDGASREQIAKQIETEFGGVDGVEELLDDVLRRIER